MELLFTDKLLHAVYIYCYFFFPHCSIPLSTTFLTILVSWCNICGAILVQTSMMPAGNTAGRFNPNVCVCVCVSVGVSVRVGSLTLDDGQEDYNDKKEEGDVKDDAIDLILVTSWVLNLVTNPSTCSDTHIHVEHVALRHRHTARGGEGERLNLTCWI